MIQGQIDQAYLSSHNMGVIGYQPAFDGRVTVVGMGTYLAISALRDRGFFVSHEKLAELCGSEWHVRNGVRELQEAGYLSIRRARDPRGRLLGYSIWTLHPLANGLLEKESTPSRAEEKRMVINSALDFKADYKPSSSPKCGILHSGGQEQGQNEESQGRALNEESYIAETADVQIPRSEPKCGILHSGDESAPLTKLNLTTETSGIDSRDDPCPVEAIGAVEAGGVIEAEGAIEVSEAKKKFDKLQDLVSFSSGLGLQNLTEEQARSIYDLVAVPSVCTRSWTDDVQFELCKPMIDALAGVVDPKSVWCAVEFYTFGGFGYSPKAKLPSYWFKDNFELVWRQAQCYAANPFGCSEADRTGLFS